MGALATAELGILNWIALHCQCGVFDAVMPWISRLGDKGILWIVLGLILLLVGKRDRETGVQILIALVFSVILCNLILKNMVDRIRPFEWNTAVQLLVARPTDPSFPSGHTSASFAAVTVLILNRWKGRWAAFVLALLIAFSRLYLYVHFPTDVLGGLVLGTICGILAVSVWRRWRTPERHTSSSGSCPHQRNAS